MCIILLCLKLSVIIILFKCQSINLNIFIYHTIFLHVILQIKISFFYQYKLIANLSNVI